MEWRQVIVSPKNKSGRFYTKVVAHTLILKKPLYDRNEWKPAYKESDVREFFYASMHEAVAAKLCTEKEFYSKNRSLLNNISNVREWPIVSCEHLGYMYIRVVNEIARYERLKPFLEKGIFPDLKLEVQVSMLDFVDATTYDKLINQLTQEQQKSLFTAMSARNKHK